MAFQRATQNPERLAEAVLLAASECSFFLGTLQCPLLTSSHVVRSLSHMDRPGVGASGQGWLQVTSAQSSVMCVKTTLEDYSSQLFQPPVVLTFPKRCRLAEQYPSCTLSKFLSHRNMTMIKWLLFGWLLKQHQ